MFADYFKRKRNEQVLKYITAQDTHLDVGCGDGWLIMHSPAWLDKLPLSRCAEEYLIASKADGHWSKITLVAVVEHLDDPALVLRECCRLLAPGGQILITSPSRVGELFVPLVNNFKPSGHKRVVTLKSLQALVPHGWKITRKWFEMGLNQLFIVEKRPTVEELREMAIKDLKDKDAGWTDEQLIKWVNKAMENFYD